MPSPYNFEPEEVPKLEAIDLSGKHPSDYDRFERAAYLYHELREKGHPEAINKSQMARDLAADNDTIDKILDGIVKPYIQFKAGEHHVATTDSVFNKVVRELLEEEKWNKAAMNVERWNGWLEDRGRADREPEQVEVGFADADDEEVLNDIF